MSWEIRVDADLNLAQIVFSGRSRPQDLLAAYAELGRHPEFRPDLLVLADYTETTAVGFSAEVVRSLARRQTMFGPEAKRAIVVSSDLGFGLARMFELLRDELAGPVQVFRDVEEARSWLLGHENVE